MINDPTSEVNTLNEAGVVTVFNSYGTGLRTWGNRSAAYPSSTHPTNFICVRRTADILHESVEYSMLQFMDYPIDNGLIDSICETVNQFIRTLIGRGALIDGKCSFNQDKTLQQKSQTVILSLILNLCLRLLLNASLLNLSLILNC